MLLKRIAVPFFWFGLPHVGASRSGSAPSTVQADCAVEIDGNAYSVPWRLIGEAVRATFADGVVRIHHGARNNTKISGDPSKKIPSAQTPHLEHGLE
ncbi:hypothetical protein I6F35_38590 [Bradyrhizobium sp. BRP22]|uniref:Mu transposase domain-containing protein n=1 Tax=Bradyrhizobium sp. BRP22 TaxID=2793821 RepID=UPI001CD1EFD0|nr:hypothetical protein [Bradyrhizobium sp. BRP22]MCA1458959.1 hypothetical protein [Bradyrhizobium sp. BRP22]